MSDVTVEQKLEMVKQLRSRYHEDQYDMGNRERILYGRTSPRAEEGIGDYGLEEAPPRPSTLKLRFLIAVMLFAAVAAMKANGFQVAGITAEKIFEAISTDYEDKIVEWVETMSSTESDNPARE